MSTISGLSTNNTDLSRASQNSRSEGGISVDGNQISWADDGHYEVQSATSYNTMSEGGTSAMMPHGTYNVINHTTGERFENVQVPSSDNARFSESSTNGSSQPESTSQQTMQADSGERDGQGEPILTITIQSPTLDNELHLGNGIMLDVEEVFGDQQPADITIEVYPEDGSDNHGFGQAMAVGGLGTTIGAAITSGIVSASLGVAGLGLGVIGVISAFFDFGTQLTDPQAGNNNSDENDLNGDGFVSGAESAEAGGFGTDEEGEFGGTPTAPPPEPVSQPTTTQRPNGNDLGSSDSDRSDGGGGGVSSSQSAEDGGYGNSPGGEFG